ncbi:hypothetical protein M9Y10_017364 [Tritrichomonas musculus]|uniref:Uncharacterized protein n=1 Tax=Tritrichomonas musculus TaxID=1915356 RepID=A0ABR2HTF7_9EUKA
MAEIINLIQEEQLFDVHWDTQPMGKVLKEILTLFQDQSKRISQIEAKITDFVEKPVFEKLQNNFLDFESQSSENIEKIKKQQKEDMEKVKKELNTIKDYVDNENLATLSESRRLVTKEISNYVPRVFDTDPIIVKMNESLKENIKSIDKLRDDFNSITIPPSTPGGPVTVDRSAVRVVQCEKKLSDLEGMIQSYPSLESDLLNMQIQFPNTIQKLERKINEIQSALESKINLKISPVQSMKDMQASNSNQNSLPSPPKKPISSSGSSLTSFVKIDQSSEPVIQPEFDNNLLQPIKKMVEMPEFLPDLEPNPLLDRIKQAEIDKQKRQQSPEEIAALIKSIPSNSQKHPSFKDEAFEIETLPNDQIVKVYETHTHVSELNSSVRVVSELEWCTKAINQHHDAIRQLQQGLKTQQENFDTITENLMRVNSTNNTRISQLAQQNLRQNQDIDELRRQISDQLNKMQINIYKLRQQINDPNFDSKYLKKNDGNEMNDGSVSPSSSSLKKKIVLPPLSNLDSQDQSKSANSSSRSTDSQLKLVDSPKGDSKEQLDDKKNEKEEEKQPKKHNFTISTTSFTINMPQFKAQSIFSKIGSELIIPNFNDDILNGKIDQNKNRIDHVDLYSSTAPSNIPKATSVQVVKNKNDHVRPFNNPSNSSRVTDDDGEFPIRPPDNSMYNKGPIVYNGDIINLGRPYSQRQDMYPTGLEALGISENEITEMIEDKVSMVARKTIAILADHAKDKMDEQAKQVKKSIDQVISLVDGKIDRDFVERMFNKFRVMFNEMNEKVDNLQCSFLEWVTRDELEMVLQKFISVVTDVKDAAATKAKYNCLLCGRPRQHLAGMMISNAIQKTTPDDISNSQIKTRQPKTVPPTAMKPTRKISTGFPDDLRDSRKRGQTALASQHQQLPRDVVQFLTTS